MSKLKPYLFWIVCGVIILVELGVLLGISPTGKDGQRTPEAVKTDLDAKNKDLEALYLKAKAGSPAGREFDAEKDSDIKDLTSNWLATAAWKPVLETHLADYTSQLVKIRDYLVGRSQQLHKPISTSTVKFDWYSEYETETAALLQKLYDNQCLLLKPTATPGVGVGAGAPPGARPPADAGAAGGSGGTTEGGDAVEPAPDFKKAAAARTTAGFLTTTQYPDAERHPELTTQFRVMELVASALVDAKATNEVSPVAPNKTTFEAHAQLAGTAWKDANDEAITVQLTLQGPISAVLAAEAALEENKDDALPIKVVTGVVLSRKTFASGERRDITSEPVILKITLSVLDFSRLANEPIEMPKAEAAPKAPSAPKAAKPKPTAAASADKGDE
jgi:hypothetical protein